MTFIVSPSSFFQVSSSLPHPSPRLPLTSLRLPSITTKEELLEFGVCYYGRDRNCDAQRLYPPSYPRLPGRRMSHDYNADNVENGLWSVSVAQTPHDGRLYNVYIKTPSHNLTLTRTMIEIVELDAKIRNKAPPGISVPPLPIITTMPTKRRSTFLKALSRLSKKRSGSSLASTVSSSPSPAVEKADPFLTCSAHSSTAANIASYLTSISNVPTLRTTRAFKRFVYVQTDDLQSTRTERPFKRLRPKLPNHTEMDEEEPVVAEPPTHRAYRSHSAAQMSPSSLGQDEVSSEASVSEDDVSSKPPPRARPKPIGIDDFDLMRVLGKGCAGKVLLVRKKDTKEHYALKAITKRHVVAHQELSHTLTEQAILKRLSAGDGEHQHPFLVKLWWSFHDRENLFLVLDFHPGGDLATQLARWGRLGRDRTRFYAAEIVEGLEALHSEGVIYRDLKPENVLIGRDGHVVLTDFGLAKEFPRSLSVKEMLTTAPSTPVVGARRLVTSTGLAYGEFPWMESETPCGRDFTATFCGTAEYLAPEMIQGKAYSYRVDWWALGTLLYEMLVGITPFWGQTQSEMYARVLEDDLCFPDTKSLDEDTKTLLRGLLERNPSLRLSEPRIKQQAYFSMIDWSHVHHKRYIPPYIPPTDPLNADDTQNFDHMFLDMDPVLDGAPVDVFEVFDSPPLGDLFDGYSFRGGNSSDEGLVTDTDMDTDADADVDLDTISMHYPPSLSSSLSHNATEAAHIRQDTLDAWSSTSISMAETAPILEDDGEDDWDVIDRGGHGEARNGARGPTLMARGVVDRYRLAFRKSAQERSPIAAALRKAQFGNGSRSRLRSSLSKVTLPPSFRRKPKRTSEPVSPLLPRSLTASLTSRGESLREEASRKANMRERQNLEKLYLHFSPLASART